VLLISKAAQAGKDLFGYLARTSLKLLKFSKEHHLLTTKWLKLIQKNYMQGPVGKLLYQMQRFLFNYYWEPT